MITILETHTFHTKLLKSFAFSICCAAVVKSLHYFVRVWTLSVLLVQCEENMFKTTMSSSSFAFLPSSHFLALITLQIFSTLSSCLVHTHHQHHHPHIPHHKLTQTFIQTLLVSYFYCISPHHTLFLPHCIQKPSKMYILACW